MFSISRNCGQVEDDSGDKEGLEGWVRVFEWDRKADWPIVPAFGGSVVLRF